MHTNDLMTWAVVWLIGAVAIVVRHWRSGEGAGLVLTYVLSFGMLYWVAPALYLLPWFDGPGRELTVEGLRVSTFALSALIAGIEGTRWWLRRHSPAPAATEDESPALSDQTTTRFLIAGVLLFALVAPVASRIPSLGALAASGSMLAVIALGLKCWNGWQHGRRGVVWAWLAVTCTLPLLTVVTQGFLGYGFAAMLTVVAFVASFYRPRWRVIVAGVVLVYLGLSVYVTYMRDRNDIRSVVWAGAGLDDRVNRLTETLSQAEWFDFHNLDHLERIDNRLNQDFLVGAAVVHLRQHPDSFANGATLWQAAAAIIPRALWPEKVAVGGSGDLVSTFTGIHFAEGTSVGIGQVMEFYANFGTTGVVIGFFALGAALLAIDRGASRALARGDITHFVLWYLPGLGLLQVGGSFGEMTSTAAAGLLFAWMLKRIAAHQEAIVRGPRVTQAKGQGVHAR